ncbi:5-bromo-4-chloroindolyl phosphate hydrolysis family protein [Halovulum sp. GXIMD14793]
MAKRYGGPHSPQPMKGGPALSRFRGQPTAKVSVAARLMFLAPLPLLLAGLGEVMAGDAIGAVAELGAFGILMLGAWLLNEGIRAQAAYDTRKVARPPAVPRKALAAIATGAGVFLASWAGGTGFFGGIVFGVLASVTHVIGFGLDPMKRKGLEGQNAFDTERVAIAIEKAEALVSEMLQAAKRFDDRPLEGRVEQVAATIRDMFRTIEDDPRDLSRARKFLSVYLMGARDATVKFADQYSRSRDAEARQKYEELLTDLESSFTQHREKLLIDERTDLDVEIEVLRERLHSEGLTA